jgi:hypothetical protein
LASVIQHWDVELYGLPFVLSPPRVFIAIVSPMSQV